MYMGTAYVFKWRQDPLLSLCSVQFNANSCLVFASPLHDNAMGRDILSSPSEHLHQNTCDSKSVKKEPVMRRDWGNFPAELYVYLFTHLSRRLHLIVILLSIPFPLIS